MLNQTRTMITSGTTRKTILVDEQNSTAFSCVVSNSGVTADEKTGRKMIKAGTPVTGDLTNRNEPFTVASDATAVGLILHDVYVDEGEANSQVLVFGFVDISKLDDTVKAMLTDTVKGALKMIQFVS